MKEQKTNTITIDMIAKELGVASSTVSRAISGKGRIGQQTRRKILDYIEDNGYKPATLSCPNKRLKTENIAVAIPAFSDSWHLPFFQRCLLGVCDVAQSMDYDVMVVSRTNDSIASIERIVASRKIDGMILTRALINDEAIDFLKKKDVPFVVIGSVDEEDVYQVDSDNLIGCRELTAYLSIIGFKKIGLIGGNKKYKVTLDRYQGYIQGLKASGLEEDPDIVFFDVFSGSEIKQTVKKLIRKGVNCIACMDDYICTRVLKILREVEDGRHLGIRVATFYETGVELFEGFDVYSLRYNPNELGAEAARKLFRVINKKDVTYKTKLGYEVIMRKPGG